MAKFIFRSNYFKNESTKHKSNFIKYLGTREGVELNPEKECGEMPKFFYEDQDMHAKKEAYVSYISERPGVEKEDGARHGLFSEKGMEINLEQVMDEVSNHEGTVWINVLSLQREDAERLGYDRADAWRNLLRKHIVDISESFQIDPKNLRWYAAFHNESYHPHVHLVVYSDNPKEGFLKKTAIEALKSKFTNDIFKNELVQIYSGKTEARTRVKEQAKEELKNALYRMNDIADSGNASEIETEINSRLHHLAEHLQHISGRKVYGYLRRDLKSEVDEIVNLLERIPEVAAAYEVWNRYQDVIDGYYKDSSRQRIPLSKNKEFRSVANAVIQNAIVISLGDNPSKEALEQLKRNADAGDRNARGALNIYYESQKTDPSIFQFTTPVARILKVMEKVMYGNGYGNPDQKQNPRYLSDGKALQKEKAKKVALGEKEETHSETNSAGMKL